MTDNGHNTGKWNVVSRRVASDAPPAAVRVGPSVDQLAAGVLAGERAMLARAISLVESTRVEDRPRAAELLERVAAGRGAHGAGDSGSVRVGITGVPGAGKSTFIDAMGMVMVRRGERVAVLAVDPTSGLSGGSILGDKTRMARLATDERAFIRPSPSGGELGGVARATRDAIRLCEAAGYGVVLVETVGVGQSETAVAGMTDFFMAIMIAGAGDELQGIKRGLLEWVDMIAVNKADGENVARAKAAAAEYAAALHMTGRSAGGAGDGVARGAQGAVWSPVVRVCSAITDAGVEEIWEVIRERVAAMRRSGELVKRRREQEATWLGELVRHRLLELAAGSPAGRAALAAGEAAVRSGRESAASAAERVIAALVREWRSSSADAARRKDGDR